MGVLRPDFVGAQDDRCLLIYIARARSFITLRFYNFSFLCTMSLFKQFRPALLFLARFLGVYVVGSLAYGFFIESYGHHPDPATRVVTHQTVALLNVAGEEVFAEDNPFGAQVLVNDASGTVLRVFEGCNGLNVMIVFVAFIVAFGGPLRRMAWFTLMGLTLIHLANLLRVGLLYVVATRFENYFYLYHKFIFTAVLYVLVFGLWVSWVGIHRAGAPAKEPVHDGQAG
jgi:exosortase family protein XrtF